MWRGKEYSLRWIWFMLLTLLCKQSREIFGQYNTHDTHVCVHVLITMEALSAERYSNIVLRQWCIMMYRWVMLIVQKRPRAELKNQTEEHASVLLYKDDQICHHLQGLFAGQLGEHMTWFDILRSGVKVKLRQPRKYAGRSRFWGKAISSVCSQSVPVSLLFFWLESSLMWFGWAKKCTITVCCSSAIPSGAVAVIEFHDTDEFEACSLRGVIWACL